METHHNVIFLILWLVIIFSLDEVLDPSHDKHIDNSTSWTGKRA